MPLPPKIEFANAHPNKITMRPHAKIYIPLSFVVLALGACGNAPQKLPSNNLKTPGINSTRELKTFANVVKVLNRIECDNIQPVYCSSQTTKIREMCLQNNFVLTEPTSQVVSSREIKELVEGKFSKIITGFKSEPEEDAIGIISDTARVPYSSTQSYSVKGFCVGSEYILRS